MISCENSQNTWNTMKFARNHIKDMSVQHIWNLSQLLGQFNCDNLDTLSQKQASNILKLPRIDVCRGNYWALAWHKKLWHWFISAWYMYCCWKREWLSVTKTLKMLLRLLQNRLIFSKICQENILKIGHIFSLFFVS